MKTRRVFPVSERKQDASAGSAGWGYLGNALPKAIALFNQGNEIARTLEDHSGIGACYFGLGRLTVASEIRIARDHYARASNTIVTRATGATCRILLFIGYIKP